MFEILSKTKDVVLDILFPPICLNCKKFTKNYICENCLNSIHLNTSLFCPICRLRLAENKKTCACAIENKPDALPSEKAPSKIIAENGEEKIQKFSYILAAAGNYSDPIIKNLIHYFKYKSFEKLAPILNKLIISYLELINLETKKLKNFVIIPIPLHRAKERQRGFNQSKLLAEQIARHFNLELMDILKRTKNTKQQAKCKNSEERMKNIAGCFQFKNPADAEKIKSKNILLMDDVFTSGATINEAVKILKQNGCKRIIALVIAKA